MNRCEKHDLYDMLTYRKCTNCDFTIEYEYPEGKLVLLGTEIGNAFDVSPRVIDALKNTDYILCEHHDSFSLLLNTLKIKPKDDCLIYEYKNLSDQTEEGINNLNYIYEQILNKKNAVMIADQGMPLIMDPGDHIVQGAISKNIKIKCFPGPDAPVTALNLSGFKIWDFTFVGFLPREVEDKREILINLKKEKRTIVFFDKDIYVIETLKELLDIFGQDKKISMCFNMTRQHENILRGTVSEITSYLLNNGYGQPRKDEEWMVQVTVVIEGENFKGPLV